MSDEHTPLLGRDQSSEEQPPVGGPSQHDKHHQFCKLVGLVPSHLDADERSKYPNPSGNTLYQRARHAERTTDLSYKFTEGLANGLLLSQVMLGAALTALGASSSSHILITVFGALNTVIAGLVAYLKSRGQPMRARMFRDDLKRVVDEIENSETLWLGITHKMHGYHDIDVEDGFTVRSEIARLTKLYGRALRNHAMNNPDLYTSSGHGGGEDAFMSLRAKPPATLTSAVPKTKADAAPPKPADSKATDKPADNGGSAKDSKVKNDDAPTNPTPKSPEPDPPAAGAGAAGAAPEVVAPAAAPVTSVAEPAAEPAAAAAAEAAPGQELSTEVDEGPVTDVSKPPSKETDPTGNAAS